MSVCIALCLSSCSDSASPEPGCDCANLSFEEEREIRDDALESVYGTPGINYEFGSAEAEADVRRAIDAIAAVAGFSGTVMVFDCGVAETINAFALPAATIVFHEDMVRAAYATGQAYADYLVHRSRQRFRNQVADALIDIQTFTVEEMEFNTDNLSEEGRRLACEMLAGVAAHEICHVRSCHFHKRLCNAAQTNSDFERSRFSRAQETEADTSGASYLLQGMRADIDGPLQPRGLMLVLEMLDIITDLRGESFIPWLSTHPDPKLRKLAVGEYFSRNGVNSELFQ